MAEDLSTRPKILSTKKLKASVIELAEKNGLEIAQEEFISIQYISDEGLRQRLLQMKDNLVFTSQHGVKGLLQNHPDPAEIISGKRIFSLENETRKAVESLPAAIISDTAANSIELANVILRTGVSELSLICGSRRRDELPAMLKGNDILVEELWVYDTILTGKLVSQPYDAILFWSPSGIESFFLKNKLEANVPCFCIGITTADYLRDRVQNEIIIAREASQEGVMNACLKYYHKSD